MHIKCGVAELAVVGVGWGGWGSWVGQLGGVVLCVVATVRR